MQVACLQKEPEGIGDLVVALTKAWHRGDYAGFASHFAEDGEVVNIYGMRIRGRAAIAGLYDMLFRSVFYRSRVAPEFSGARRLCEDAMLVHMRVGLHVPFGSMAGDHDCVCSVVLERHGSQWRVASLHNTLVSDGVERQLVA